MVSPDKAVSASTHEVTRLLQAWASGDDGALERLMPLVYKELHRLAHRYMAGEQPGQTLQTTALVHEVFGRISMASAPALCAASSSTSPAREIFKKEAAKSRI